MAHGLTSRENFSTILQPMISKKFPKDVDKSTSFLYNRLVEKSTSLFLGELAMIGRFEVFTLGLSEIMSSWNKIAADEMSAFGLKGTYVIYLIALYKHHEGLTSANLSEMCNRDKAEVSRAIKALESKGLIVRENTTVNGYRAKITLTRQGREATKTLRERVKLAVEKGGDGLTEEQRESFYNALEIISANLKKISKEGL